MPGWYPDPSGQPGQFRFWDGAQWSQQTSPDPTAPAPGTNYAYGQPQRGGSTGRWVAIGAVVVVLALVAFLVIRGLGGGGNDGANEDTNSSTPTVSGWDETSTPTPTPTPTNPTSKGGDSVSCPNGDTDTVTPTGSRLQGGGISVERIGGWSPYSISMSWVYSTQSETKRITDGWMSVNAVGALKKSDGFTNTQTSAKMMMECFASSHYYRGFTGSKTVISEAKTISGKQAYHLRAEIYVDDQGANIPGDTVDVIVVDTGDADTMGVYFNSATIGDATTQAEVDKSMATLTVN